MLLQLLLNGLPDECGDGGSLLRRDQTQPLEDSFGEGDSGTLHAIMIA